MPKTGIDRLVEGAALGRISTGGGVGHHIGEASGPAEGPRHRV